MRVFIGKYPKRGGEPKVRVSIDCWDTWSLDTTLARIIHPALIAMRENSHGSPRVDDEDVPAVLHAPEGRDVWGEPDEHWHDRWAHVLDEMIWSFAAILGQWETTIQGADEARVENGLRLFGKYYRALWT